MQQLTKMEQSDTSNTQSYGENTHKDNLTSQQLFSNEPIEDTPFRLVGSPIQGYAITLGNKRLTEPKPTPEKAKEVLNNVQWNLIANMIIAMVKTYEEVENKQKDKDFEESIDPKYKD